MGKNPSQFWGRQRPVENVSWRDVQRFLGKLNGLLPGLALTLPTEARWEYACRAGTTMAFSFEEDITPEQVNYDGNYPYAGGRKGLSRKETVVVESLPPNAWGLYEMHGNVYEWCLDGRRIYGETAVVDPVGPTGAGFRRVIRGGCWDSIARDVRCAFRRWDEPGYRFGDLGFRCARAQQ